MRPTQRMAGAALALAAIAGFLSWAGFRKAPIPPDTDSLCPFPLSLLDEIEIHDSRTESQVHIKVSGVPRLLEPLDDFVEPAHLIDFERVMAGRDWGEAPQAWRKMSDRDLGLEPASKSLVLYFSDGNSFLLRLGARDPAGDWVAGKRDGVRVKIGLNAWSRLNRTPQDWRDRRLVREPGKVAGIHWQPAVGEGFFLRKAGSKWVLSEPFMAPMDPLRIGTLQRLLGARADHLPTDAFLAPPPPGGGLVGSLSLYSIPSLDSNHLLQRTRFAGSVAFDEDRSFHPRFLLSDLGLLAHTAEDLRSSQLVQIPGQEIFAIRFDTEGKDATFLKTPQGWTRKGSGPLSSQGHSFLDAWIREVSQIREVEGVDAPSSPPSGTVTLSRSAGLKRPEVLTWWGSGVVGSRWNRHSIVDFDLAGTVADFLAVHAKL